MAEIIRNPQTLILTTKGQEPTVLNSISGIKPTDISEGQLCINTTDGKVFFGKENGYTTLDINNLKPSVETVSNITVQGTADATTAKLIYGINVITSSTNTNFCARLPYPPIQGKIITIINTSLRTITVFPSITGGSINGAVNGSAIIPNDSKPYIFTCYENPLPGAWTWTPPAVNQLEFVELSVAHTNGVGENKYGITQSGLGSSSGIGLSGNNITLTGEWITENNPTTISLVKCYTNIVQADLNSEFAPDEISVALITGFKSASNAVASGQRNTFEFSGGSYYTGFFAPVGTLTPNPNEAVGDTNTLYDTQNGNNTSPYNQIGMGGTFSRYYYTFGIFIPASAATKTYKFKFFIEYF
jgi:hypothetical protein